ncbi:uncharacterized protein LOC115750493 [Rhodamnia argentea]|uniref:Uncharacterized protein LOC115750493 n=1 Tax=Rhodamnia argentea TaxID=178133 RepID=A0A8B8Q9F4_9MYRT|nr:uncharacterized protein LOC115750493 [Rhodamnia argentea]XP_048128167.1 uncharacterized protein LOC115750493 [Rhodamnia argentea]
MEPVAVRRIDRKSSIESEPRTLGFDQIQFARELAEYVMNTRSIDEALTIFTSGLKPVVSSGAANADTAMDPNEEYFGHGQSNKLQWPEPRDVLSAPF